jgi:hypothetical protein
MNCRFIFLTMVALVGCDSQQDDPLTQTEYCTEYAQYVCEGIETACLIPELNCTTARLAECTSQAQAQVSAGRVFLPSNADIYLSKVSTNYSKLNQGSVALGVSDYKAMLQARDKVYRGKAIAYEPCPNGADADCIDGLVCDKDYCGTAKMVSQGGAGCANIGEYCSQGYYCSNASGAYFCANKVGLGGACSAAVPCLENLRCSDGVCTVQAEIGIACSVDQDCSSGFCHPYAGKCAKDIRFADGSAACLAMSGSI